ncbi:MAG: hypothetical protein JSV42_02450 [Chloroflexota bacterium]|nr:MAG: hypothetical protein JSV42_02450 [Chloroflexota bacterium]
MSILFFTALHAHGQGDVSPNIPIQPYQQDIRFVDNNRDEGLSNNGVFAIVQDQTNPLMIGTVAFINLCDGYDFNIFKPGSDNPNRISDR